MGRDLDRPAIRFVIWSWPTDPQSRRVKEYRENSQRSVWEGKILAAFLRELGTNEPIGLIGYSFGAQAVVSATEAACQGAANEGQGGYQFRIACVAPAFQKPWSQVEDPFAGCAECVTSTLPIGNSVDRALRVHRCLSRIGGVNYACTTMVDDRSPWTAHQKFLDVGEFVGKRHDLMRYVTPPYVAEQIRTAVLDGERSVSSTR
jgi:hypothetical protein